MPLKKDIVLYPHQEEMVNTVINNNGRAGIFSSAGSGKTLGSIAASETLVDRGEAKNFLVIVPASLKDNFKNALLRFTENNSIYIHTSGTKSELIRSGEGGVYTIVSMALFRKDPEKYMSLKDRIPDSIIVDEIHKAKNIDTRMSQALIGVSKRVRNFIALSASPTSNAPREVVPLMMAITGKRLPISSPEEFDEKFTKDFLVEGPDGKPQIEKRLINLKALKALFSDSVFYMDNTQFKKQIPRKQVSMEDIEMSEEQQKLYNEALSEIPKGLREKLKKGIGLSSTEKNNIMGKLQKARALSVSTAVGRPKGTPIEQIIEESPKLAKAIQDIEEHLKTTPDGKIIVFSQFIHGGVDTLSEALKAKGIKHSIFAGKGRMQGRDRKKEFEDYRSGKTKVLVASPAAGLGLSFPDTTMEIMLNPPYNPEKLIQQEARGIRIGGQSKRPEEQRKVLVKRYVSTLPKSFLEKIKLKAPKQSIEQWIYNIVQRKQKGTSEFKQVLEQLKEKGPPRIKPVAAPKKIYVRKEKKGLGYQVGFRKSKRKVREDKGRVRGKYKKRGTVPAPRDFPSM